MDRLAPRVLDFSSKQSFAFLCLRTAALLMVFAMPFHLVAWGLVRLHSNSLREIWDVPSLDTHVAGWLAAVVFLALVALPFARRGREARWTIYLVILVYGGFLLRALHLIGTMSYFVFYLPLIVLLVALFVDSRAGLMTFIFYLGVISLRSGASPSHSSMAIGHRG